MTPEEFAAAAGVSRETLARLEAYAAILRKWQRAVNLVGAATLPHLWHRHFLDSAQLFPLIPQGTRVLLDLGSGAGFPGLVLAIMGFPEVHLVESDARKGEFLREAARAAGVAPGVVVHRARVADVPPFPVDVVTARALAPLDDLIGYAAPFLGEKGVCLFPKGKAVERELTMARKHWTFALACFPSVTDPAATVLRLEGIRRERVRR